MSENTTEQTQALGTASEVSIQGDPNAPATAADGFYEAAKAAAEAAAKEYREQHPEASESDTDAPTEGDGLAASTPSKAMAAAADPAKEGDKPAEDDNPIAKLLAKRVERDTQRVEANDYRAKVQREAETHAQTILRQAQEQAARLVAEAEHRARQKLEELLEPDAVLARKADANDPTLRQFKALHEELAKRDKVLEELRAAHQQTEAREQQRAAQEQAWRKTEAEKTFLQTAKPEDFPHLHALYSERQIVARAWEVIGEVRAAAEAAGETLRLTDADILKHLEREAKSDFEKKAPSLSTLLQKVGAAKGPENGDASQGTKANKPRTLSAQGASERRASPKPASEMTEAEFRKEAMRLAREASKATKSA